MHMTDEEKVKEYRIKLKSQFFLSEPQLDLACQGFKDGYKKGKEEAMKEMTKNLGEVMNTWVNK